MTKHKISFIIPAYNEEKRIQNTIISINQNVPGKFDHEVIVVDHGSEDDTYNIAQEMGVNVLLHPEGSIASLRNHGAKNASGDILIFLDADVLLTENWNKRFVKIAESLISGRRVLTGSWVGVPSKPNWIENNWFKPLQKGNNTHINSGHLIISKLLFDEIGGFNEDLETGEDYELSMRAKSSGIDIIDDIELEAIHYGFPQDIKEFFLRELWHGKGDCQSIASLTNSKVACVSLIFLMLHLVLLFAIIYSVSIKPVAIIISSIITLVGLVSFIKYRTEPISVIMTNIFLYYVYFLARTFSLITLFGRNKIDKHER